MAKTYARKRIEVLVDMPLLPRVEKIAADVGVKIFTVLPTRGGGGVEGRWFDDRVTGGAGTKVIFSTVTTEEKADMMIAQLEPLLDEYGIVLYRSEVEVIRSEKF